MKPHTDRKYHLYLLLAALCMISESWFQPLNSPSAQGKAPPRSLQEPVTVDQIEPDPRGGKAYRLTYVVRVPIDVYWNFKTDFDNDFLVGNKYIREHRFISRNGDIAITENKYTNAPDVRFKWQTTVFPERYRLDFWLQNPEQCGQGFHYGSIQLEAVGGWTRVTQVAYFDFWGASLWADYPWGGGMVDFLTYTARWEQELVLRLKNRYVGESSRESEK